MNLTDKNIIKIGTGKNSFKLLPERGAIIFSLVLDGKEILFQDMISETLFDESKSVRGGIPIMFPQAGPISLKDSKKLDYKLPQHGVARINEWKLLGKGENYARVYFDYKMQTGKYNFPYNFEVFLKYSLDGYSFKIDMKIVNNDSKPFALSHGFHPYFSVLDKGSLVFNNSDLHSKIQKKKNIWKNDGTISLFIPENNLSFSISNIGDLELEASNDFKKFWIWSMKGKNFVCIEPVVGDEGNICKDPIFINPGESLNSCFRLTLKK